MMMEFNEIDVVRDNTIKPLKLNAREVYLIRLILHGFTAIEIKSFLEIELDQYFQTIAVIKLKLGCSSWYQVIIKGFKSHLLNHEDFIDNLVKQQALVSCNDFFINRNLYVNNHNKIYQDLLAFQLKCNQLLKQAKKEDFSIVEQQYLQLKFNGVANQFICEKIRLKPCQLDVLQENLFIKLQVNDWYNSFKRAFQFELLTKRDNASPHIDLETEDTVSNISSIFTIRSFNDKEKELMIYHELLKYYSKIEFQYLSQASL